MIVAPLAEIDGKFAEGAVISVGVALLIALVVRHARRRDWAEWAGLPAATRSAFTELDLLAATLVFFFMPWVLRPFLGPAAPTGEPVPTLSTSEPSINAPSQSAGAQSPSTQPGDQELPTPAQVRALAVSRLLSAAVLIWLGWTRYAGNVRRWGLTPDHLPATAGYALVGYLCIWPACAGTVYLTHTILEWASPGYVPKEHETIRLLLQGDAPWWVPVITVFHAIVLAPVVEEVFFRGILQAALAGWVRSHRPAILLSAGLFGVIHYPQIQNIPALTVFAIGLGYLYARTGSLTLVIVVHSIFNAKTLLFLAFVERGSL